MAISTIITLGLGGDSAEGASTGLVTMGFGGVRSGVSFATVRTIDARTVDIIFTIKPNPEEAQNPERYAISPALRIVSVKRITDRWYRMITARQENDQVYVLTASGISPV